MKQKLKKFKLLLTISLAGLLLFSCQVEKDITSDGFYEEKGIIMHKKFEELIQETQFKTAFEKISKPKKGFSNKANATYKTAMEEQYGFTIANCKANVVITDSITSYTFLISRENNPANVFENLIVSIKQNQEPKAYILKYESTTSFDDVPYNFNSFSGIRSINRIIYDASPVNSLYGTSDIVCDVVIDWICPNHSSWEDGCTGHSGGGSVICSGGGAGGGPGGYGDGFGGGHPYSSDGQHVGGAGGVHTATVPNIKLSKDPCEILTPLAPDPKINAGLNFLKPKTLTKNEFGYAVTNGWNASGSAIELNTEFVAGGATSVAGIETGGTIAGGMHNHPSNGGAIPSIGDLDWLMHCEQDNTSTNDGTAFTIVVVANPELQGATNTYAVTINDLEALQAQMALNFALPKVLEKATPEEKMELLLDLQAKAFQNALTSSALEKKFLEYFSKYGVNLAKFDPISNKWNNLKLQNKYIPAIPNAANSVISEPCN